ncbi:hypothetical protein F2Q70_00018477 [Brassica cretica]|uniref:Uncharacterized protein n=1 Tax=Brassica cretica TaxID=69181 RepID=A0A8S9HY19_BRACR|nr:hypothetical protein F2Q70_00018477 [Brassica cretica]
MWRLLQLRRRRLVTPEGGGFQALRRRLSDKSPSCDWVWIRLLNRGVIGIISCLWFDGPVHLDEISTYDEALRWLCQSDEGGDGFRCAPTKRWLRSCFPALTCSGDGQDEAAVTRDSLLVRILTRVRLFSTHGTA